MPINFIYSNYLTLNTLKVSVALTTAKKVEFSAHFVVLSILSDLSKSNYDTNDNNVVVEAFEPGSVSENGEKQQQQMQPSEQTLVTWNAGPSMRMDIGLAATN